MARSGQPGRTRSFKASYVDRLIVGAVDGSQIEPARASQGVQTSPIKPDGASLERHWHPRTPRGRPRSVSGASWGVHGTPQQRQEGPRGRPGARKGAPGSIRERAEATKIEAESHWRWKTSSFSRAARSGSVVGAMLPRVSTMLQVFVEPANPLKYCACQQKRRCGPVRSRSNCPRDGTSKNNEKR